MTAFCMPATFGAFTRGETKEVVLQKMIGEVAAYLEWKGEAVYEIMKICGY